jgi:hypothetical protein
VPHNETAAFQCLHHAVHRRRGDKEVSLDVRLRRRPSKLSNILFDKAEVLTLTLGRFISSWTTEICDQPAFSGLDVKNRASNEMNTEVPLIGDGKVGHFASCKLSAKQTVLLFDLARHWSLYSTKFQREPG